jgi:hypothetical protein
MSQNHRHIEKGMFLRGGEHPVRTYARTRQHPSFGDDLSYLDHPDTIREIKQRQQRLQEALDYIRNEKPPAVETQEQWLRRMGYS